MIPYPHTHNQSYNHNPLSQTNPIYNYYSQNPSPALQIRKKILHYSYSSSDSIGSGYSSTVFKGQNTLTHQPVAIKVIDLKFINDKNKKKFLQNQLDCLRRIKHQHLLSVCDIYETINNVYIVTEFCQGGDLQQELKRKGKFSQKQFGNFFVQLYSAYVNLLQAGYIHRDIKPANILLKNGEIKLADFGIVKKLTQDDHDNINVGTIVYMAPQSLKQCIYNSKTDVWAMGVMFYQMTHGKLPWKIAANSCGGFDKKVAISQIINANIKYDNAWLGAQCISFISSCLDRNTLTRVEVKNMMEHPWAKKAIKQFMINQKIKKKNSQSNIQILNKKDFNRSYTLNLQSDQIKPNLSQKQQYQGRPASKNKYYPNSQPQININYQNQIPSIIKFNPFLSNTKKNIIQSSPSHASSFQFQRMRNKIVQNNQCINPLHIKSNSINISQAHNYMTSIINYTRYLHQVIGYILSIQPISNTNINIKQFKDNLMYQLIKQMMNIFQVLKKIITSKDNLFDVNEKIWGEYIHSDMFSQDSLVVNNYNFKYKEKYSKMFTKYKEKYGQYENVWDKDFDYYKFQGIIKKQINFICEIVTRFMNNINFDNTIMQQQNLSKHNQTIQLIKTCEILTVLYQVRHNLFIEKLQQFFINSLNAQQIVKSWPNANSNNFQQLWQTLLLKINLIFQ